VLFAVAATTTKDASDAPGREARGARGGDPARDWTGEALLGSSSRGRPWLAQFEGAGLPCRVAPAGASPSEWLREVLGEDRGPTLLHTHFSAFDLPALRAPGRRGDLA
jgi:hypothetical protein